MSIMGGYLVGWCHCEYIIHLGFTGLVQLKDGLFQLFNNQSSWFRSNTLAPMTMTRAAQWQHSEPQYERGGQQDTAIAKPEANDNNQPKSLWTKGEPNDNIELDTTMRRKGEMT
jgi:hypothetical protein